MKRIFFPLLWIGFATLLGCGKSFIPLEPSSKGEIRFLFRGESGILDTGKTHAEKWIGPFGDSLELEKHWIKVPSGTLSNDTLFTMDFPVPGLLILDLGPEGVPFLNPVEIEISYQEYELGEIDPIRLTLYWNNSETGEWEAVQNSRVDTEKRVVRAPLEHFSRYALSDR